MLVLVHPEGPRLSRPHGAVCCWAVCNCENEKCFHQKGSVQHRCHLQDSTRADQMHHLQGRSCTRMHAVHIHACVHAHACGAHTSKWCTYIHAVHTQAYGEHTCMRCTYMHGVHTHAWGAHTNAYAASLPQQVQPCTCMQPASPAGRCTYMHVGRLQGGVHACM